MHIFKIKKDINLKIVGENLKLKNNNEYVSSDAMFMEMDKMFPGSISGFRKLETIIAENSEKKVEGEFRKFYGQDLNNKTLLCWRTGGFGDILFITPNFKYIKENFTNCKIIFATSHQYVSGLKYHPYIDEVYSLPLNVEVLNKSDYHLIFENIIEGNPNARNANAYDLYSNAFGFNLTTEQKLPIIGINSTKNSEMEKYIKKEIGDNYKEKLKIGIHMFSSGPIRTFPAARLLRISVEMAKRGYHIFFIGSPGQEAENIDKGIYFNKLENNKNLHNAAKISFGFESSVALINNLDLILAPDSSVIHIAGSLQKPCIGLYGPFSSATRIKYYKKCIGIDGAPDICYNCNLHQPNPCPRSSTSISPCFDLIDDSTVIAQIERLIEKYYPKHIFNQDEIVILEAKPKTEDPLVSIIMPVFGVKKDINTEIYFKKALESASNLIYENWELIIINDEFPENQYMVRDIVTSMQSDKIKYIENVENLDVAESRNVGLKMAKGKYITYMDCDDLVDPLRLSIIVPEFEKNKNLKFIYTSCFETKINREEKFERPWLYNNAYPWLSEDGNETSNIIGKEIMHLDNLIERENANFVLPGCVMHTRDIIKECGFWIGSKFVFTTNSDGIFWQKMFKFLTQENIKYIKFPSYTWRRHSNQESVTKENSNLIKERLRIDAENHTWFIPKKEAYAVTAYRGEYDNV